MGQRLKKIHLISGSKFFDTFIIVIKQALSSKLRERLVIHPDFESLYKEFPREQFPKDFGGDKMSLGELQGMYTRCRYPSGDRLRIRSVNTHIHLIDKSYLIDRTTRENSPIRRREI